MIFFVRIKLFTLSRGRKSKFTTDRFIFIRSLNIVVDMYLIHLYKITVSLIVYFTSNYLHNIEASLPIYKLSLTWHNYSSQYKCGVFLEELVSDFPITWLGALPDALKKVTPAEYKEILGEDIAPESFENFNCDITAANSRCYATVI